LIGGQIYQSWHLASSNIKAVLVSLAPHLKPLGSTLLRIAADGGTSILQFLISIIVAGFLFCPGPSIVKSVKLFSRRLARDRAEGFVDLAGATIRAVSLGVVGVSVLQALLAGLGLTVAGIPGASVITSAVLILGIVQIGPSIVIIPAIIWSWITMETTAALLFTVYMVPVTLLDNILKPIVMTRGLRTPMLVIVIGVIGGTLGYGITGLFLGPIVLSVIWELITAWMAEGEA
jgi:predicted PurR-regulated permease PerM